MDQKSRQEVKDNVDQDVVAQDHEETEESKRLVLLVVGQADPVGEEDHRGGEEDDHGHKDGAKNKGEAVDKPEGWLHQGVKDIVGAGTGMIRTLPTQ